MEIVNSLCPGYDFIISKNNVSLLYILGKIYGVLTMYDRFYNLNNDYEIKLSDKNKTDISMLYDMKYLSFDECCHKRTQEIIRYSNQNNKNIYILYSGGVDSTVVLCSFLMNIPTYDNLYVLHNDYSIQEYPFLYEHLHKVGINFINFGMNTEMIDTISQNDILVTGMCGDQLDGSNLCTTADLPMPEYADWKDVFGNIVLDKRIRDMYEYDMYIAQIEDYATYILKRKITTFKEFAWLFNFCCKWNYISDLINMISSKHIDRISYFDTLYFQKWCLQHITSNMNQSQKNPFYYKTAWKRYIFSYTKDNDYMLRKGKEGHYFSYHHFPNKFIIHDSEDNYVYYDKNKENVLNIMKKYSDCEIDIFDYSHVYKYLK